MEEGTAGRGGSLNALRARNRDQLLDSLRIAGTASRAELARRTGLSRSTVSSLVADLQDEGLVVETVQDVPGPVQSGRPPVLLALNPAAGAVLGVDFGHRHLTVAVADLSARVLAERRRALDVDRSADEALDTAAALVEEVLEAAGVARERVIGCGMGLPGPLDQRTGRVGSTVILPGWAGLAAGEELSARIDVSVVVDNDANLGALGEVAFGAGRGARDVVYVKVSSGLGAGSVLGGRLHRGTLGLAGEIGHVPVHPDGAVCRCGKRGCLETVAAAGPLLALLKPTHGADLTTADLVALVHAGDEAACRLVTDAGRAIGRALSDVCNWLNPELVIVGGDLGAAGEPLLGGMRESIGRYALPAAAQAVRVQQGVLGDRAEVLGALALVIQAGEPLKVNQSSKREGVMA